MNKIINGINGNVRLTLRDQYGNIKQDFTKKNSMTTHGLTALLGRTTDAYFVASQGWYTVVPYAASIYLCSSNPGYPPHNENVTAANLDSIWNTQYYFQEITGRTYTLQNNPGAGDPYMVVTWVIPIGSGTGTIKTLFVARPSAWHTSIGMVAYLLLDSNQWVYKSSLDSLTVAWSFFLSGDLRTRNEF
jgi:hypothetical protein